VPFIDQGMDVQGTGATLTDIAKKLNSLEQKINQIIGGSHAPSGSLLAPSTVDGDPFKGAKPHEIFAVAARDRNVQLMDSVLDRLRYNTDEVGYLDRYASVAASMGSDKGGAQLLERAIWFTENGSISFRMKIEYLGCLVSYLNRKDQESANKDLVEKMCAILKPLSTGQPNKDVAQIYNQLNRLYHGIYSQNDDPKWLRLAIENLEIAKQYVPQESYVYFNLATCYRNLEDYQSAKDNILSAIDLDRDGSDEDHLYLACRILSEMGEKGTTEYNNVFSQLNAISPVKARLIDLMK
jgi:tetratricopeptide (TPR) repeat protein